MTIAQQIIYINSFLQFAKFTVSKSEHYNEIVPYANCLNLEANKLIAIAAINKEMDISKLQSGLFKSGSKYVRIVASKFHAAKISTPN